MGFIFKDTDHEPYWDLIKRIIKESDIVLEILDARVVELSRNEEVEKLIEEIGRPMIYVINKSDLVTKESLKEQISGLKTEYPVIYISTKTRGSIKILLYNIKKMFQKYGKRADIEKDPSRAKKLKYREAKANIVVGVLGYPNVGKSSVINKLCHKKKVRVGKKAGTTHGIHWVTATNDIKLIDSPGVIPLKKEDEIRYGIIGARGEETLRHPDVVAHAVIKLFMQNKKKKFEDFYDIKIDDEDPNNVVDMIAQRRSYLLKGGKYDENKVASIILRDWRDGKLRL